MMVCGGKTSAGGACQRPAGWGTAHVGTGRCKLHGGASPSGVDSPQFKHGRYSKVMPQRIADTLSASNADPLDLLDELDLQRGLLSNYLARFNTVTPQASDIAFMMSWLSDIGRTVERIVKMRNETALTRAEMTYLAARIADLVGEFIPDVDRQQAFIHKLFDGLSAGNPSLLGEGAPAERA